MGENQFFISYSRHQLYFAEGLALSLQEAGLDVWMDLHQLEPGSDWQDQIDEGLRNCAALLLVASKQSLSSSYVESEWRAVMDSGKPVYIVYYGEVNLPPTLRSASLVDFRGSFKRATSVLVTALENMSSVRETVQSPNRLGLPQKMPPMIMLVAGLLVIEAFFALLVDFTALGGISAQIACLGISIPAIWALVWQFLQHKGVLLGGRLALWLLIFFFSPLTAWLGTSSGIGSFMNLFLLLVVIIAIYKLERGSFGAELLRWSIPGTDNETITLRRRFHKSSIAKEKQIQNIRQQVLTARNVGNKVLTAESPSTTSTLQPTPASEEMNTYSLHYATADIPVVNTLRKTLDKEGLHEVDANAQHKIVILSEYFPRSKLRALLDSSEPVLIILIGNIVFQGDTLMERVASLQLIDYRERSKPILSAFARTLKGLPDGNLPVGFETIPRPLNSAVLPLFVSAMLGLVVIVGGWLVLGGLVSITQSLVGAAPVSMLDFAGFVCGLIWIKLGNAVPTRQPTNLRFVPALLISTWIAIPLFLGSFIEVPQLLSTNAAFDWRITLNLLFTEEAYLSCLLCSGVFVVAPVTIVWYRRFGDWLPASISRPEQADPLESLVMTPARQRPRLVSFLRVLFISGLSTFGLRAVVYALYSWMSHLVRPS